jgi:hypothetical protein
MAPKIPPNGHARNGHASKSSSNGSAPRPARQRQEDELLVLRTYYVPPKLDNQLRQIAEDRGTSKNEVLRNILTEHLAEESNSA